MTDELDAALRALTADLPLPRTNLTESEKDDLVSQCGGPSTAKKIVKAVESLPRQRIAFLFNAIDTQMVVDILANDMADAIARAEKRKKKVLGKS